MTAFSDIKADAEVPTGTTPRAAAEEDLRVPPRFDMSGRTIFVTGAAGHLGRAMARSLAEAGAVTILNGRNADSLQELREDLAKDGLRAELAPFDIIDTTRMRAFFADYVGARIDGIVNNAFTGQPGTMDKATPKDFDNAFRSSVTAVFEIVRAAQPLLERAVAETGTASVVNIASMYGMVAPDPEVYAETGLDSAPHYSAAKGGLLQLTRYLAGQFGPRGIRVNAIAPGPCPSESVQQAQPVFVSRLAGKTMLGRIGRPEDVAGAVHFLMSDAARYVTGITLPVDGGSTAW